MATNFSIAPLRLASLIGLFFSCLGLLLAAYLVAMRLGNDRVPEGWTSLMVMVLMVGGIQLLALGAIGEYMGRVFLTINKRPQFVVASMVNFSDQAISAGVKSDGKNR